MKIQAVSLFNNVKTNNVAKSHFRSNLFRTLKQDTVSFSGKDGKTLLMKAIEKGNNKTALFLLKFQDKDINKQDNNGKIALDYAREFKFE